jgi:DNA-binding beta-propeller fold protein YncE
MSVEWIETKAFDCFGRELETQQCEYCGKTKPLKLWNGIKDCMETYEILMVEYLGYNERKLVAVDSTAHVYVAGSGGSFIRQWGTFGTAIGQFQSPQGLEVDKSDIVYVADTGNSRIQKFKNNGAFIRTWGSPGIPI